jgi:capsular polysaccharide biosynthesis protein
MKTVTIFDLLGTIRRRFLPILIITVLCGGLVAGLSLLRQERVIPQSYTAEATILLSIDKGIDKTTEEQRMYNSIDETRALENARYIVLSDSVAGEVRRKLADRAPDLVISSPYVYDTELGQRTETTFVFVDATSTDPQAAVDAADEVAVKAAEAIVENLDAIKSARIYESAFLKGAKSTVAANPGQDVTGSAVLGEGATATGGVLASIDLKFTLLALFVGLFGSAFCFCAYEILNRKIRTVHDAEALIGIPVITRLSALEQAQEQSDRVEVEGQSDGTKAEGQRELGVIASDAQVFFAKNDRKVIGVGSIADPVTSKIIAERLTDEMKARGMKALLITGTEAEPVSLASQKLLIEQASSTRDVVIVDVGALAGSADAAASASATDVVLLVTQAHRASNGQIKKAIQQLQIADVPLLGVALIAGKPKALTQVLRRG